MSGPLDSAKKNSCFILSVSLIIVAMNTRLSRAHYVKVAHTWIEETRNAAKERKSNQMWGITYFQQSEDSPTIRVIFTGHIVLVSRISVCL